MGIKKIIIILFIHFLCLFNNMDIFARTIALVFDDSGSMWRPADEKKESQRIWIYANYAAQILNALLRSDDKFVFVKMSDQKLESMKTDSQSSIDKIRQEWTPGGSKTPYEAVEKAMNEILKSESLKDDKIDEQKQDWLIIMTDGEFGYNGKLKMNNRDKKYIEKQTKIFFQKTKGKVRIAFFLIGKKADINVPKIWKLIAPAQVEILNVRPEEITYEMQKIAAFITGRDFQYANIDRYRNIIEFKSLFPVKRITVLEQNIKDDLSSVMEVAAPDGKYVSIKEYDVENNPKSKINLIAKISHCEKQKENVSIIMPDGKYIIKFKENLDNDKKIQVLIETAVDFKISLIQRDKPFCINELFDVSITFYKAGTNELLTLNRKNTKDLNVNAIYGNKKHKFNFNPTKKIYDSLKLKADDFEKPLSVEAKYPGYFYLKSNIFNIFAEECFGDIKINFYDNKNNLIETKNDTVVVCSGQKIKAHIELDSMFTKGLSLSASLNNKTLTIDKNGYSSFFQLLKNVNTFVATVKGFKLKKEKKININSKQCGLKFSETIIEIPYIFSNYYVPVNKKIDLSVDLNNKENNDISADNIPDGIEIEIMNKRISASQNKTELINIANKIPIKIYRNKNYKEYTESIVKFYLSDKPDSNKFELTLKPKKREITLVEKSELSIPVNELGKKAPFEIYIKADDSLITKDELQQWNIQSRFSGKFDLITGINNSNSTIYIKPMSLYNLECFNCLVSEGIQRVKLSIDSPFPLEDQEKIIEFNIEKVSLWKKCYILGFVLIAFGIILGCFFVNYIKPKFMNGAAITYRRYHQKIPQRPRTEKLINRFLVKINPFAKHKQTVGRITFFASNNNVLLVKKEQGKDNANISIDGTPQDYPLEKHLQLSLNEILEEEESQTKHEYTYIKI